MKEVSTSLQAYESLRTNINPYAEELWILALDSQMNLIRKEMVFRGTADFCLIHPRDIFRILIASNASSFILAHNHPSNSSTPSEQDLILTRKIHQMALLFEIPLNDHLVICADSYFSMADHGYFKKWKRGRSSQIIY
ncbi:JAB domain-containing protein [Bdellovibrio bacteriovorus]|uniref:JAB domain-containing protein n=1 Tax=Bdellovibrio bacteriovorus TaxID=959 RepID=UPI0021CF2E28|nr:JAB domain-containing protein [Bdellovibrio bacteriovorus]UXR65549.1 JAB domain-containing protein [Bdellovibrio bacteriovorus]